ncbi:hypothetical protein I602_48 [Polaribacter dokdonensis DSW-5]|uniref:Uncharacterized protein n=1 Tax=Polaribacter dokdonensis DSW-5 TaxID=1300348 RepID=A0A0N0CEL2_9FLAO|nr:hypothetical protein I602_48 [Polaribacter dokdonensis DSW-5]
MLIGINFSPSAIYILLLFNQKFKTRQDTVSNGFYKDYKACKPS